MTATLWWPQWVLTSSGESGQHHTQRVHQQHQPPAPLVSPATLCTPHHGVLRPLHQQWVCVRLGDLLPGSLLSTMLTVDHTQHDLATSRQLTLKVYEEHGRAGHNECWLCERSPLLLAGWYNVCLPCCMTASIPGQPPLSTLQLPSQFLPFQTTVTERIQ